MVPAATTVACGATLTVSLLLPLGAVYGIIYTILTAVAVLSGMLLRKIRRQWPQTCE